MRQPISLVLIAPVACQRILDILHRPQNGLLERRLGLIPAGTLGIDLRVHAAASQQRPLNCWTNRPVAADRTQKIGCVIASPSETTEERDARIKVGAGDIDSRGCRGQLALGAADVGPVLDDVERHAGRDLRLRDRYRCVSR